MRPSGTHLYKRVCPSVGPSVRRSVRPSVCPSVTQVQKPRFLTVFGHGEVLYWIKWSTNVFRETENQVTLSKCPIQYTQRNSQDASLPGWACLRKIVWTLYHISPCLHPDINDETRNHVYREKSRSQSSTSWHIREKQGFHFLMGKLGISTDRLGPPMKLIG